MAEGITKGPASLQALMDDWALVHQRQIGDAMPGGLARFHELLRRGLDVTTHYSGTGAPEQALRRSSEAAGLPRSVSFYSTCDNDSLCREVLEGHPLECRAQHSFEDLFDGVPESILNRPRPCRRGGRGGVQ